MWMPAILTVRRPAEGYTSRMVLDAAWLGPFVGPDLFEAQALPAARNTLERLATSAAARS